MYLAYVLLDDVSVVRQVCEGGEDRGHVSKVCLDAFGYGKQIKDIIFDALFSDTSFMSWKHTDITILSSSCYPM